ncbi:MAG: 7-cyano-7-deazaguanine synthase QueC [Candidatus Raymondbacteria bacterium RifOxyA12_full_50_37]|uniref:7-cyano-7-deazaguanine synthase n=1 Tax=Candidatus Raymondbacteria bacterium RIFOXYD12_FULL_49_13 TaxID=1817890 RepID=A0A1F7F1B1_UNCRA|nr:MAG: 7-cyano-7-deazaguanine synthase QueC [Candidatus Raymondbacteria bacterium RifOxyA12_full_50_37]OGJ93139.1 MAG: 7-cyano-7-deazaguanine synthase QueC [Candidatus Raymondbacteria bacterium RifOxyB12_full_50_8]OGJ93909.1 MAG: 7-cyano-7-deazaguanine synthase QueC [Candidatus Raymondbacteria bacterium RIFOXYA2_FULL_49_16]OGJ98222.1 MAG: 7-cyano-7-deazaguanine synthase QueC [Candidatus Raymondbacteria bacterium RIFOXYC2_FULL_50_21]OGK00455.1 MAG: 7-cyano-7-deazaguanine synthase QueC [Candidat
MKKKNVLVIVSGGINSCLTAALVAAKYNPLFLHVSYGQKVEKRELKAFKDLASYFKVKKRLVASIKYLKEIGGSSLTDRNINIALANGENKKIPTSYVAFLNTHCIAIAVSWAEVIGVDKIFFGANEGGELSYPDCSKNYFAAMNKVISEGTRPDVKISLETPLISLKKSDIVKQAQDMGLPLHLTWSCYKNNDIACGECDACMRRLKGFKKAKLYDPLEYMVYPKL